MNKLFEERIINMHGKKGEEWLNSLPKIIEKIAQEWNLIKIVALANLSVNYVADAWQDSKQVILKIGYNQNLIRNEITALIALKGFSTAKVLAHKNNILLLEKISPGVTLKSCMDQYNYIEIGCNIVSNISNSKIPKKINLSTIEERFKLIDQDWNLPKEYLMKARKFRDQIFSKQTSKIILHGDLHYENILKSGNGWKIIDPHGVIGFPINEVWTLVHNIEEDIPYIAKYFGFSEIDILKTYYMHSLLSAVWAVEDKLDPSQWLNTLKKIYIDKQ